nr:T9SS type A sorting domain-containing protein [Saprospiraceae bacterium]
MKQYRTISLYFLFFMLSVGISAQSEMPHVCGFHPDEAHIERLEKNVATSQQFQFQRSNEINYVPVKFHLIAQTNGTGRVTDTDIFNQMCILNENFAPYGFQFFLKDNSLNYIDNSAAYNDASAATPILRLNRDNRALNIYFANNITSGSQGGGTTLGYYDPQEDWVAMRNDQISSVFTLSHEIGHFFSLMHTFFGWESDPYEEEKHGNPVTQFWAPNQFPQTQVELMDGSNCSVAADRICDTPPDYNFGSRWMNCAPFTLEVLDRNNDLVKPMQNNYMSYFFGCSDYLFTPMQSDAMKVDFSSFKRNHLRNGFEQPDTAAITGTPVPLSPMTNDTSTYYDEVTLVWDGAENATFYYLEVSGLPFFGPNIIEATLVTGNEFTLTDLQPHKDYYWRVKPLNGTNYCTSRSSNFKFTTSDLSTGLKEFPESEFNISIAPNPTRIGSTPSLIIQNEMRVQNLELSVYNVNGQLLHTENITPSQGYSKINLNKQITQSGMYYITVTSSKYRTVQPLIVQ